MPPFYPYFIALFMLVFGPHLSGLQLIQIVLGSVSAVLVYVLARRLFDRRVALIAFLGYMLYGNTLFLDTVFLPNAFIVAGELLILYLVLRDPYREAKGTVPISLFPYLPAGILLGLLGLIRSEMLVFLPLFLVAALIERRIRSFAWLLAGSALVIAPVFAHNLLVGKDPVPVSYNAGLNLYIGNNPRADGTWQPSYPLVQTGSVTIETLKRNSLVRNGSVMKPSESSSYWTGQALDFIRANPGRFLGLIVRRLGLFAGNYEIPNNYYYDLARQRSLLLKLAFIPFGLILALGLAGMILRISEVGLTLRDCGFYLFFLIVLATSVLFFTVSRLRAPVVPLLVIFGSYFIVRIAPEFKSRPVRGITLSVLAAAIFVVSFLPRINRRAYALEGYVQAGNSLIELGRPAEAQKEFRTALELNPGSVPATYGSFRAAAKLKNRADAERYSSELYRSSRSWADSVYALLSTGLLGTMTGNLEQARDAYLRALEKDPQNSGTRYLLALVYLTLNDYASAKQQAEYALSLDPEDPDARTLVDKLGP